MSHHPTSTLPTCKKDLLAAIEAGALFSYGYFWGHRKSKDGSITKSCLSQWWEAAFEVEGRRFATAEHYMMFRKAELFGDHEMAAKVLEAPTPRDAKSLGRKVRGFNEAQWLAHREEIVFTANLAKFTQNPALRSFLHRTAPDILVEASPMDAIWGIGASAEDPRAAEPGEWPGLNLLGFALVKVREQLGAV